MLKYAFTQFFKSSYLLIAIAFFFYFYQIDAPLVYTKYFGIPFDERAIHGFAFIDVYNLFWFFLLPAIVTKFIYHESLKDIGIAFPKKKLRAFLLIILASFLLLPCIYFFAKLSQFKGYSLGPVSTARFLFTATVLFPLYYLGEECFFRGFLFLGLWSRVRWHSFWITTVLFTLAHIGKPGLEILLSIPASIIFNCLTLFTRSIVPAVIVHSMMGIMLSVLVTFQLV